MAVEIRSPGGSAEAASTAWSASAASTAQSATASSEEQSVEVSTGIVIGGVPYGGVYEITPSEEEQTLSTRGRTLGQDLVVAPIPSNYGLITYDGTSITVS